MMSEVFFFIIKCCKHWVAAQARKYTQNKLLYVVAVICPSVCKYTDIKLLTDVKFGSVTKRRSAHDKRAL